MRNLNRVLKLLQFLPVDYNLIKRVITSFNNLHYDTETGIMHSLPAARVHELRGRSKLLILNVDESISLMTLAASISSDNSLLECLLVEYIDVVEKRKKGQKTFKHLLQYVNYVLHDVKHLVRIDKLVLYSHHFRSIFD